MTKPNTKLKEGFCKECKVYRYIGIKTKECLECLDWKMDDLRK